MTGPADTDAQGGSQDQGHGLTPELWEWISRTVADLEPLTDDERQWRAQTLKGASEDATGGAHARAVILPVHNFRLPVVLEHIEAGRIVIVVPDPPPAE